MEGQWYNKWKLRYIYIYIYTGHNKWSCNCCFVDVGGWRLVVFQFVKQNKHMKRKRICQDFIFCLPLSLSLSWTNS